MTRRTIRQSALGVAALAVLTLVLGTIFTVGWYLEGARPATEGTRPDAEPRVEHVWRTYSGTASTRRQRGTSRTSGPVRSGDAPTQLSTRPAWTPAPVLPTASESTTFEGRIRD